MTASSTRAPRGRRSARPSGDEREQAILATAERLLQERSLADISVDDLAKGAGLSRPTFYFYFKSKEAVLLSLLEPVIASADAEFERAAAAAAHGSAAGLAERDQSVLQRVRLASGGGPGGQGGAGDKPGVPGHVVVFHAEVDRLHRGHDHRRTGTGRRTETIPPLDLATSLNQMNERTMMATLSLEQPAVDEDRLVDTLTHIWVSSIYGEAELDVIPLCEHMFVRCDASILHADLDSFYASVEQRDDPTLRGRPVIVGGGVVLAASYEAKAYGVRTAMGGAQARRLCPHAVVVPPRMSAYSRASDDVFEVFRDCTPIVEPLSVDEAFLDVGGLRRVSGTPVQIGGAAARGRARPSRPAHHGRDRPDEVPREGRQPGSQARRAAAGAAG